MTPQQMPVMPIVNPLTAEDHAILDQVHERAIGHADVIARAKEAGLDLNEHEARNEMHLNLAKALKAQFFPTLLKPPHGNET